MCGYTNHTLLPEALEQWPVDAVRARAAAPPADHLRDQPAAARSRSGRGFPATRRACSGCRSSRRAPTPHVRMAHLALAGSHKVNGVAAIHSELVKRTLFPDFYAMWPERFTNKTNGITPRRWLLRANPALSAFITERIGDGWITDLAEAAGSGAVGGRCGVAGRVPRGEARVQGAAREAAAARRRVVRVDPDWLFDIHAKRIHEYKRQLLNALHVLDVYLAHPGRRGAGRAARARLRRQGGAGLRAREADHQVHQQRRRSRQRRSAASAAGCASRSSPTTASRWPRRSRRPPICPSRSRRRARRRRAPAT